mmetsp:Transcript_53234/g.158698  ORF Transcript_53234/g.158698 Transcript_53234/m.158698 type:complete len:317 (+) Transcript_53234:70-1020(+)
MLCISKLARNTAPWTTSEIHCAVLHALVGLVECAFCCLGKPFVLHGNASLDDLALHVRQVEGVHELAHHNLWLLGCCLQRVHDPVDLVGLESGLCEGAGLRSLLHSVGEHLLQVGVHGALVHTHDLAEHLVLAFTEPLLGLPPATLLRLPQLPVALCELDHGRDAPLLLEAEELLGELVQRLGDDAALDRFEDALERLVPKLVNVPSFLDSRGRLGIALCGAQLVDQVEALLFALKHAVLVRPPADDALQQQHRRLLLLLLRQHVLLESRGVGPVENVAHVELLQPTRGSRCLAALCRLALRRLLQLLLDAFHGIL